MAQFVEWFTNNCLISYRKDENREKEAGNGRFINILNQLKHPA